MIILDAMARTAGSHSDITGPRIREGAMRLFACSGYAAVSMRQIAATAGLQAGALYNYTPDKQTLLYDLMDVHMRDVLAHLPARSDDAPGDLLAFVHFHIAYHYARPDAMRISYMELRNLTADNFAKIEKLRKQYELHLERILMSGNIAGHWAVPDPKICVMALIAMLNGVGTWFRENGRLSLKEVQDLYWELVRGAVGARLA